MRYRFGTCELDTDGCALIRSGERVPIGHKAFDLLCFLIEHRARMLTKQELLDVLWQGEDVNESVLSWTVSLARRAIGQTGRAKTPIETFYKRGYRWTAPIELVHGKAGATAPLATTEPRRSALPFVGRADLMKSMQERLAAAQDGRGALCLLVGEAGIGKTRCMDEVVSIATSIGFAVWPGRAAEDSWAPALWPWTRVLRAAADDRGSRARAQELLAQISADGAQDDESSDSPATRRVSFALLDEISRFLLQASRSKPLLILLDDLHWADAATIALLATLAPELRRHPLLILAAQRDASSEQRVRRPSQLARATETFHLSPLTTQDVGEYIDLVTHAGASSAPLSTAVHTATAGNALFLEETIRVLIHQHGIPGLLALPPTDVRPPSLARDVLKERLDALDTNARALLATASVLGESFDTGLLQKVSNQGPQAVAAGLDQAIRIALVNAESEHRYRFCHALLRSVLYDDMCIEERILQHRRAAEVIEALTRVAPRQRELAHHYYRSLSIGQADVVTGACRRAAEEALHSSEFDDAVGFSQWALEAQAVDIHATARGRAELLLLHARAARRAGKDREARASLTLLVDLAKQHDFVDLLVRIARILRPGRTWSAFTDEIARTALEHVLSITTSDVDEHRVSALSQLASVAPHANDMERSKATSATALALARQTGSPSVLAEALRGRLYALSGPDDIDAMLAVAHEMLSMDPHTETWISIDAYSACYAGAIHRGDIQAADDALATLGRAARAQRRPEAIWYYDRLRAQRRFMEGNLASVEKAFAEMANVRLTRRYTWLFRAPLALLAMERDETGASAHWDPAMFLSRASGDDTQAASIARIAVKLGRDDLARPVLEKLSSSRFAVLPKDYSYLYKLVNLALVAIALRDTQCSEDLYALLTPYPKHNAPSGLLHYEGSVSHYLALLAEFLGDYEVAEHHFEDALAFNESLGHKLQLARTYYEYARFLRAHGAPENMQRMRSKAEAMANEMGMTSLLRQLQGL